MYARAGWKTLDTIRYSGEPFALVRRDLQASPPIMNNPTSVRFWIARDPQKDAEPATPCGSGCPRPECRGKLGRDQMGWEWPLGERGRKLPGWLGVTLEESTHVQIGRIGWTRCVSFRISMSGG